MIPVGKKEPVTITAKVGTLKRKQQMRDFLDHLPKDNHDDVFTATPFQNRRVKVNVGKRCTYGKLCWLALEGCYKSAGSVPSIEPRGFGGRGLVPGFVIAMLRLPAARPCGAWLLQTRITAEWTCKTRCGGGVPSAPTREELGSIGCAVTALSRGRPPDPVLWNQVLPEVTQMLHRTFFFFFSPRHISRVKPRASWCCLGVGFSLGAPISSRPGTCLLFARPLLFVACLG